MAKSKYRIKARSPGVWDFKFVHSRLRYGTGDQVPLLSYSTHSRSRSVSLKVQCLHSDLHEYMGFSDNIADIPQLARCTRLDINQALRLLTKIDKAAKFDTNIIRPQY